MKYLILLLTLSACAHYKPALSPYTQANYMEISEFCDRWHYPGEHSDICHLSIHAWESEKDHWKLFGIGL